LTWPTGKELHGQVGVAGWPGRAGVENLVEISIFQKFTEEKVTFKKKRYLKAILPFLKKNINMNKNFQFYYIFIKGHAGWASAVGRVEH